MEYKFSKLFSWKSGKSISEFKNGPIPVYGSNGIIGYTDKGNFFNKIILGRVGAYCGSVEYCPKEFYATDNTLVTTCNEDIISYLYAQYLLKLLKLNSYAGGSAQPLITQSLLNHIKCDIPQIDTQKEIASILSKYDELIENNNKRIKILQQMAENLYKEWFVRFRFPGYENAEFENGIPIGWDIAKLGNLTKISTGKCNREDAEEDGIYPLFDRSQEVKKSNSWIKDCEAIIVPGEGTSFIPRYYKGKFNLHQRCYCVEPIEDNIGFFIYQTLKMNRKYFLSVATGATVPSLRLNNFLSLKFILPNIELCNRYNLIVSNLHQEKVNLDNQNQNLTKQRDLLLPRLMSGKLKVQGEISKKSVAKVISFEDFINQLGMAARATNISDSDLRAMYEAYIDDDATE